MLLKLYIFSILSIVQNDLSKNSCCTLFPASVYDANEEEIQGQDNGKVTRYSVSLNRNNLHSGGKKWTIWDVSKLTVGPIVRDNTHTTP